MTYYDGTKLLSLTDLNGNKPEIYICTSNRTAGKTTYFSRLCVNRFKDKQEKFCIIYRFNYELDNVAEKFFKDIGQLFFPGSLMTDKKRSKGLYVELYLDGESCGYAISLNAADQVKKQSHFFSDVSRMLFDEFQSENNHYCDNEIDKLMSVHTSIARGKNKQVRYVPLYMLSNTVSLINPYYTALGISNRLKKDTRFLRGDGFVLEQSYNESAAAAVQQSGFNRAFSSTKYIAYASQNVYLNDNDAFISKPVGKGSYICTLKADGAYYGVREYASLGIVYIDTKADMTYPIRIAVTTDDHQINYVMLRKNDSFIQILRNYFIKGCFRFQDLKSKDVLLKAISY